MSLSKTLPQRNPKSDGFQRWILKALQEELMLINANLVILQLAQKIKEETLFSLFYVAKIA